jgi:hypothetical protein
MSSDLIADQESMSRTIAQANSCQNLPSPAPERLRLHRAGLAPIDGREFLEGFIKGQQVNRGGFAVG